jgi:DNA mismatch repair protein MutS2
VADIRKTGAAGETVKETHRKLKSRKEQVLAARKKLHGKRRKKPDPTRFNAGDMVRIISLNQEGEITEMIGNNKARVRVGGITTTAELRNLHHLGRQSQPTGKKSAPGVEADTNLSPEIHLMGMTVDEAREALDRYIYQAVVACLKQIYVIHGKGTGRLRKGLVEYLKEHPEVESMRMGNWNEGGAGVTIVKLKE